MLAQQMLSQGDRDQDRKLSKMEIVGLAEVWFDKLDRGGAGKLKREEFLANLHAVLVPPAGDAPRREPRPPSTGRRDGRDAPGGGRIAGPSTTIGPGLFAAADADRDGSLTRLELEGTFEKWFTQSDAKKSGALDEETLYAGLAAALPQARPGGIGGIGDRSGSTPKPLTAEQVGLIRAWIDQGAR